MKDEIEIFKPFKEPKSIEFMIPVNQASALTTVAKEIDANILIDKEILEFAGHRWRKVFIMLNCYTDLFAIGLQTGLQLFDTINVSPLKEIIETIQNKMDKLKNESNE